MLFGTLYYFSEKISFLNETLPCIKTNGFDCMKVNDYLSRGDFYDVIRGAQDSGIYTLGHITYSATIDDAISAGMSELSHVELLPLVLINGSRFDSLSREKWGDEFLSSIFKLFESIHRDSSGKELRKVQDRLKTEILKLNAAGITITTTITCDQAIASKYIDLQKIASKPYSFYLPQAFWNDLQQGTDHNAYFRGQEWAAELLYELIIYCMGEIRECGLPIVAGTDAGPTYIGIVPGF